MAGSIKEKKKIVSEIKDKISNSKSVVFVNYKGINVEEDTKLRRNFRKQDVEYKIYKNRLIKIALDELGIKDYDEKLLEGTTSIAFGKDEVSPATILYKAIADFKKLEAKFGLLNNEIIDKNQVEELSKTPSKETLIAMLMSLLNAPVSHLARTLDAIANTASK